MSFEYSIINWSEICMNKVEGIKKTILKEIDDIKGLMIDKNLLTTDDLLNKICEITYKTGKEVAIYIDRRGEVLDFSIGDENTVSLKELGQRRSLDSLNGIRCIHTHPNGNGNLSDIDISALKKVKYDLIASIGVKDGLPTQIYVSYLVYDKDNKLDNTVLGPFSSITIQSLNLTNLISEVEKAYNLERQIIKEVKENQEKAILVGTEKLEDLDELSELLKTAGGYELSRLVQNRDKSESGFYIGTGKLKELQLIIQELDANLVIFDDQLTGIQLKNLEEALGTKVVDRTQLILDIFAQRALTREGKLQVELAQLKYLMPRLIGVGKQMSRTGGGIGTRGPGEKKLEIDRRRIRNKINDLENELKEVVKHRSEQRKNRKDTNIFQVCLVGYTNAGKSTLLNTLADANIYAMDQLFATLDPTTRKVALNSGKEILITDTVGFIKKLPHYLVEAFKSTLEEVIYADLLIHVVDMSNSEYENQMFVVDSVLAEIGAAGNDMIIAYNKCDKIEGFDIIKANSNKKSNEIFISASNKIEIDSLLDIIEKQSSKGSSIVDLLIPYSEGSFLPLVHENGKIIMESYIENGIQIKAELDTITISKLNKYLINI